ncbi:MAG: thioredoxin fold domain-containing protein [Clostridium sp.]|nr:thioredoxin fold domain-containing protein [Clostridium sp.]
MKKNVKYSLIAGIILVITLITVTSCMAILPKANMKPSDYDTGLTYEQAAAQDKPLLAVFYVDWCTYCKKFMPRMDKVRNINKDDFNFVLINVENPQNEPLVREYRISGYPSVYIIDPKYDNRVHIDNPFLESVDDLNKEVSRYKNFRNLIKKGDSCK